MARAFWRPQASAGKRAEAPAEAEPEVIAGKGHATPSRRDREAANRRPLVPTDRKAAAKQSRAQVATDRERARIGMMNGEERYLGPRDRGPQKRYVRDWMDARWSIGELVLPLAVVVLIASALPTVIAQLVLYGVWAYFVLAVIDFLIVGQKLTRRLRERYGDRAERIRLYAAMRGLYPRFMRAPKAQVKRGAFPSL